MDGELEQSEGMDAVDALVAFVTDQCELVIDRSIATRKDEFAERFNAYCERCGVEPPSRAILGTILVTCYPAVFSDTFSCGSGYVAKVWRNLRLKGAPDGLVIM